mgnify:CR=1 FL=1
MNIFALSTGRGPSGIAILRLSGKDSFRISKLITKKNDLKSKEINLCKFYDPSNNKMIDEGLLIWCPGPNSYTGEDLAEFHTHGSNAVVSCFLRVLGEQENCRLAEPGEFTKIAFQNNKINLLKAESISDLISSETEIQREQAIKIMSGKNSKKFLSWREGLLKVLSKVEAKIDFPEDDLPKNILEDIKIISEKIKNEIKKTLDDQKVGERIREGFKIAIVGPTNAGKSSLLNYISRRDVAIVSEIAGTTRDVIETHLNINGLPVVLSDTAGIRQSKDEIEKKGIKLALKKAEDADLNIVLIEPKSSHFTGFLKGLVSDKSILVVNKSDLGIENMVQDFKNYNPIYISLKNEKNIDQLISAIKDRLKNQFINSNDILITRERHRENLEKCVYHLESFNNKNEMEDFDKAAEDLRLAIRHLGIIVGTVDVEEVLGSIFEDFCIGK